MFDFGDEIDRDLLRVFTPPRRMIVSTAAALWRVGPPVREQDRPSLKIRSKGASLAQNVVGEQHFWFRADTGAWVPFVTYSVRIGGALIPCQHPMPPDALRFPPGPDDAPEF